MLIFINSWFGTKPFVLSSLQMTLMGDVKFLRSKDSNRIVKCGMDEPVC